jgi:ATP-binding cassette subfamily B protein
MKQFFDLLTGNSAYGLNLQALVVLLITVAVVRSLLLISGIYAYANLRFRIDSLLQRNMLAHIVKEPGARAIPYSPGEAISNFRDDVEVIAEAMTWSIDMFSIVVFAAVSFVILFHIHAVLAMTVFLPLIVIVAIAQLSTVLLQKYRAAYNDPIGCDTK